MMAGGRGRFADGASLQTLGAVQKHQSALDTISAVQENDAAAQSADAGRLRDVVSHCNALGTERPRVVFSTKNLEQDLARLLRSGNVEQHRDVLERPLASAALAGRVPASVCSPSAAPPP